ncbi:tetratricopeptide repeat protein [Anaerocolumna chitinilytica]|uniref:Tetratricopeptide repeat protein n=1 Tax=Anaerocolumna chitinilytica TaxID=1727145 RepID=A0A7M3SB64_9FIRM|nr:tetratricopeptide repeat protein [Anaerocolumna chitinilytica]BCK01832.1 hypothetical protein bsdcttw_48720 [Anaerocolumna chitinilytica]
MERYDNIVKIEEIRKLTDEGQYQRAVRILDTMDLHRIKSLTDLSILADVLTENERFDEAMELLNRIYDKSKTRRVIYQMVELAIKQKDVEQAEEYLLRYQKAAPHDSYRFIFRYYIDKLKGEPADTLIDSLEQLKEFEYIEVWAYELAKLYHKAGMKDKCIRECSDIILWFGEGIYVDKAKLLKAYYVGEIDPVHILKAKDRNETIQRLGLDKTKDYRNIREQINEYLSGTEEERAESLEGTGEETKTVPERHTQQRGNAITESKIPEAVTADFRSTDSKMAEPEETAGNDHVEYNHAFFYENGKVREMAAINKALETTEKEETEEDGEAAEKGVTVGKVKIAETEVTEGKSATEGMAELAETEETAESEDKAETKENEVKEVIKEIEAREEIEAKEKIETRKETEAREITEEIAETEETKETEINEEAAEESIFTLFEKASFDYQKELGGFLLSEKVKTQFRRSLEGILSDSSNSRFLCIIGEKQSGKTSLALKICKGLFYLNWIKSDRIAKISGENLNKVDIRKQKEKLNGCSLIIENPGEIQAEAAKGLYSFFRGMGDNIFAILEGSQEEISRFLEEYPLLKEYFAYEICLTTYTLKQLVLFAVGYLENNNYILKSEAKEAITNAIESATTGNDPDAYGKAMKLAVRAKKAAGERYKALLGDILSSGKLTEEDLLYITKEDIIAAEK